MSSKAKAAVSPDLALAFHWAISRYGQDPEQNQRSFDERWGKEFAFACPWSFRHSSVYRGLWMGEDDHTALVSRHGPRRDACAGCGLLDKPFRFTRSAMRRFAEAKKAHVVLAEENEALLGFVILHVEPAGDQSIGYIVTLDVALDHRRKGLAAKLMQAAEQEAMRKHCAAMVLHVFASNESAIRFYESQNFVRSHRDSDFYGPKMTLGSSINCSTPTTHDTRNLGAIH